jgi:hypothetical protein
MTVEALKDPSDHPASDCEKLKPRSRGRFEPLRYMGENFSDAWSTVWREGSDGSYHIPSGWFRIVMTYAYFPAGSRKLQVCRCRTEAFFVEKEQTFVESDSGK